MKISVDDLLNAQIRSRGNLDETKNCSTCQFNKIKEGANPCVDCFNSFMGVVFTPSNYKALK